MFKVHRQEMMWAGRSLTLETGKIARQANGAVLATYGETSVLCTVTVSQKPIQGADFFPLSVHYQEKTYAVGKFPGGFIKRESKPSDKETLTSRLIDRIIRPLFTKGFSHEVQVLCTVLEYDGESDPAVAAITGTSAAIMLAGLPFHGPIGAARIGKNENKLVINPSFSFLKTSELDLMIGGTKDGILMVESQAKELDEKIMVECLKKGHEAFQPVLELINTLVEQSAPELWEVSIPSETNEIQLRLENQCKQSFIELFKEKDKAKRKKALKELEQNAIQTLEQEEFDPILCGQLFEQLWNKIVRELTLETKERLDGRSFTQIREIQAEVGFLKRPHGSALFTRGQTQSLVVTTLGSQEDSQSVDSLDGSSRETFLLHYNFPSFSVGEVGRMGPPGRREIGHGRLAWKAIQAVLPDSEKFSYVIRVVSDITESNGSSSMATVCGTTLSLMDAGVPIKAPVSGIAMGLVKEGNTVAILSDILGDEDGLGDMDFKVAGTRRGITALQMDLKICGISFKILEDALEQAKEGREYILQEMLSQTLSEPRTKLSDHAPRMTTIQVAVDKIKDLIGPGGKNIKELCETGAKIDVSQDGEVKIFAQSDELSEDLVKRIKELAGTPEVGEIYTGSVTNILDFGAFVNFFGKQDGLVHISEISNRRINQVSDVLKVGDIVNVKVIGFDKRGKVKLSIKQISEE